MKKIKRGIVNGNNKMVWNNREYPIVEKSMNGYDYVNNKIEEGLNLKFKIVHKPNGVHKRGNGFSNILCAELFKYRVG